MGFVENVNKLAQGLSAENLAATTTVADNIGSVVTTATSIADINNVALNITAIQELANSASELDAVIANLPEILLADDNAVIATTQAGLAQGYATYVETLLADFDTAYLGSYAVPPTTDKQGNPITEGALYWNTVDKKLYIGDSLQWYSPTMYMDDLLAQATTAKDTAVLSATNAAASASDAEVSATAAAGSALSASTSESNAAVSEANAALSETASAGSAAIASTKADEATTAAASATSSEAAAEASAIAAASSANIASTSATTATTQADIATTAATEASASANSAASALASVQAIFDNFDDIYLGAKAGDPTLDNDGDPLVAGQIYWNTVEEEVRFYNGAVWERPEYSASQSAINAASSASSAVTSAANAATSETNAANSEAAASTSAISAADSATSASTSATDAASSANAASISEANAADSATSASASANAAEISATEAASLLDQFDDRYLGPKASDPAADNNGNTLQVGTLYWNTSLNTLKIWTGSVWNAAAFDATGAVISFNTRVGAVTLLSADVTTALGYTPEPANANIQTHISSTSNPHSVTADQIGAYTKAEVDTALGGYSLTSHAHTGVYEPADVNIQSHIGSTSNPHGVTAAQVGTYARGEIDALVAAKATVDEAIAMAIALG